MYRSLGKIAKILFLIFAFLFIGAVVVVSIVANYLGGDRGGDVVVKASNGRAIFVDIPRCNNPRLYSNFMLSSGNWVVDHNRAFLSCKGLANSSLRIEAVVNRAKSEYLLDDPSVRLIEKNGKYNIYRLGWKGVDSYEVVSFIARDGYRVYLEYQIDNPDTHSAYRRIDKDFEIRYTIHNQPNSPMGIMDTDEKIATYVRSIVKERK